MDVKQQEYFIAIAEERSISKAAKRLYISQPSLSQYLAKLEDSLNKRLFVREKNGTLTLTDAGTFYYESAREIVKIRDQFLKKLSDLDDRAIIDFDFGINAGRGIRVFSSILSAISSKYPNIHAKTRQAPADVLANLVASDELDVAFSAYDVRDPKLKYIDFLPSEVVLVLSPSHSLASFGTRTPSSDLPHLPLDMFKCEDFAKLKTGTVLRRVVDEYCNKVNVIPNIKVETHDIYTALSVVESSSYVTLCPYDLIPNAKYAQLSYIGLNPPLYYQTGIYYNKSVYQTKFMRDFLQAAKKLASQPFAITDERS